MKQNANPYFKNRCYKILNFKNNIYTKYINNYFCKKIYNHKKLKNPHFSNTYLIQRKFFFLFNLINMLKQHIFIGYKSNFLLQNYHQEYKLLFL